jgi:hypothetical protein
MCQGLNGAQTNEEEIHMKLPLGLIVAVLFAAIPALGQTSSRDMKGGIQQPQQTPPQEPSTAATPGQAAAAPKPAAAEKVDPEKEAAIRHLMEISGAVQVGESVPFGITQHVYQVMSHTISGERLQKFMETFKQKFDAAAPASTITDVAVPIYARNFTMDEIRGLNQFYESSLGQRLVKTMPIVDREWQSLSTQQDQKTALEVLRGMSDEYAELKPLLGLTPSSTPSAPAAGAAPAATAPAGVPATPNSAPAPKAAPAPPQQ